MKKYKVLKSWDPQFKVGDIVEMDDAQAKDLLAAGGIEEYDPVVALKLIEAKEAEKKEHAKEIADAATKAVKDYIEAQAKDNSKGGKIVFVKDEADKKGVFKNIGDQLITFVQHRGGHEDSSKRVEAFEKVAAATGLNEAVDSEGGFLVQTDLQPELESQAFDTGQLVDEAQTVMLSNPSNTHEWNAVDDSDRTDGNRRGGITVSRTHEAKPGTSSKPRFERRKIVAEKLTGSYEATEELLQDATALTAEVSTWFGEEFSFIITNEMIRGSGAGEALGVLNSDALVEIVKEDSQTANTLVTENVEKMFIRMWPRSIAAGRAQWKINQDIWAQLFGLQKTVGTGGLPVFLPPNGLADAPFGTLLGLKIQVLEQCSTLGTVGDIILADFSQYKIVRKGGLQTASSIHVKFLEGETTFRFTMRINGQPKWRTAMTPANGSNTQSPFVALATRS